MRSQSDFLRGVAAVAILVVCECQTHVTHAHRNLRQRTTDPNQAGTIVIVSIVAAVCMTVTLMYLRKAINSSMGSQRGNKIGLVPNLGSSTDSTDSEGSDSDGEGAQEACAHETPAICNRTGGSAAGAPGAASDSPKPIPNPEIKPRSMGPPYPLLAPLAHPKEAEARGAQASSHSGPTSAAPVNAQESAAVKALCCSPVEERSQYRMFSWDSHQSDSHRPNPRLDKGGTDGEEACSSKDGFGSKGGDTKHKDQDKDSKHECGVCLEEYGMAMFERRVYDSCSHFVCRECFKALMERPKDEHKCPTCRGKIAPELPPLRFSWLQRITNRFR